MYDKVLAFVKIESIQANKFTKEEKHTLQM